MPDAKAVGRRPLAGRRVVVTRARAQGASLISLLKTSGANVLHTPVIEIAPPASWDSLDHVIDTSYDWLVFTSVNGVQAFFARSHTSGLSLRAAHVAAVGSVTADALREHGVTPDVVPERFVLDELIPLLPDDQRGVRTAVIRAEEGREDLIAALRDRGGVVDLAIAYRTIGVPYDLAALRSAPIDAVTFTSPSTVEHFFGPLAGTDRNTLTSHAAFISIGPSTTEALRRFVDDRVFEAETATMQGLHDAVVQALTHPALSSRA